MLRLLQDHYSRIFKPNSEKRAGKRLRRLELILKMRLGRKNWPDRQNTLESKQNQGQNKLNLKMNKILLCKFNRLKNIRENLKLKRIKKKQTINKNLTSKSKRESFIKKSSKSKMIKARLPIIKIYKKQTELTNCKRRRTN